MTTRRLYPIVLHLLLIGLAVSALLLARQNRELRKRLTPAVQETAFTAGQELGPIPVVALDGTPRELHPASATGERLVFFFTTTCGACKENQEQWKRLHRGLDGTVDIVGVSLDGVEATRRYREDLGLSYETVAAADPEALVGDLRLDLVPETVLLDARGRVLRSWLGVLGDEDLRFLGLAI